MDVMDTSLRTSIQEILDALAIPVAILDMQGAIVVVNEAWRRLAAEDEGWVDECARAIVRGAGPVLRKERATASIEYEWNPPKGRRWFAARVSRFTHGGGTYLAAVNEEGTAKRLAQDAVQEAEAALSEANATIKRMNADLQRGLVREQAKTRTDDLTGLYNRRHFYELSEQLFTVAKRYGMPFSILLFDIDDLKGVNERLGQAGGDAVLRCVGRVAREHSRGADVFARYGGEQFVAALPNTPASGATAAAEKLRGRIASCGTPSPTISVGIAELGPEDETLDRLVQRADEALRQVQRSR
jgi:diguanylate cyclase (GGDEF)-like protein